MCLAVPAKITERQGEDGWVDVGSTRMRVNLILTPEAQPGDWVLVHAGFAIQKVSEEDAKETWAVIAAVHGQSDPLLDGSAGSGPSPESALPLNQGQNDSS